MPAFSGGAGSRGFTRVHAGSRGFTGSRVHGFTGSRGSESGRGRPVVKFQKLAKDRSSLVRVFSISVLVTQRQSETSGSRIGEVTAGCVAAPVMPEAWEDVCVGERRPLRVRRRQRARKVFLLLFNHRKFNCGDQRRRHAYSRCYCVHARFT